MKFKLSTTQEKYLLTIPEDKIVKIVPFEPHLTEIGQIIIAKVNKKFPELKVLFMGASGLGISGQGDIDIYILSESANFLQYLPKLKKLFGEPQQEHTQSIEWSFTIENHDVELYLTDPNTQSMKEQILVYEKLKSDKLLLGEYKSLKETMNGKSQREYQRKKYEFYNRILSE